MPKKEIDMVNSSNFIFKNSQNYPLTPLTHTYSAETIRSKLSSLRFFNNLARYLLVKNVFTEVLFLKTLKKVGILLLYLEL